ncbi:MAG: glycosyltransferase [Coleofasciculus sp. D1-CHI-01]|uniref:glycosyltransferase family 2 protein n=1 Tax=Coleofasciculus sp. D1-CHI-01 TaxID=3068482 RepID=UPI0032F81A70
MEPQNYKIYVFFNTQLPISMPLSPFFSVVIPTYHRNDLLVKCLDCLAPGRQTLSADQYEVIITDDGSHATAEKIVLKYYTWAKWVAGSSLGPACNRNNGAKYTQGEWLVFTDDDCLPDPQWLEAYRKAIAAQTACLVFEGRVYVERPRRSFGETAPVNESGGYLWSCNFAIHRQLFEFLGGFDERFPYAAMEDVDLRLRITKSKHKFIFVKEAAVCHPWRYKGNWKQLKKRQESVLLYLSIHPDQFTHLNYRFFIKSFIRTVMTALTSVRQLNFYEIKEVFEQSIYFLRMSIFVVIKSFLIL